MKAQHIVMILILLNSTCGFIYVKRCCSPAERFNFETKSCVTNRNSIQFNIEFINLNYNRTMWTVTNNDVPYKMKFEICEGISTKDPNFKVTQNGTLVNYTSQNQNYYVFYNDFCIDVDHKSGERISIICNNKQIIRKCCEPSLKFIKESSESYKCQEVNEPVYLNDIQTVLFKNHHELEKNIEYQIVNLSNFESVQIFQNPKPSDFQFYVNETEIRFNNTIDFCLDKFNEQWIVLVKAQDSYNSLFLIVSATVIVLTIIVLALIYCSWKNSNSGKRQNEDKNALLECQVLTNAEDENPLHEPAFSPKSLTMQDNNFLIILLDFLNFIKKDFQVSIQNYKKEFLGDTSFIGKEGDPEIVTLLFADDVNNSENINSDEISIVLEKYLNYQMQFGANLLNNQLTFTCTTDIINPNRNRSDSTVSEKKLQSIFKKSVKSDIEFKILIEFKNDGKLYAIEVPDTYGYSLFLFGQAEYRSNPINLTFEMIMETKEFRLSKYFDSLAEILQHIKSDGIKNILIIINNKINDVKETNGIIEMKSKTRKSSLFFVEDTSDNEIFKDIGKRFKFPDAAQYTKENEEIFNNLKSNFIARKLVEFLFNSDKKAKEFCHQNRKFLFENIFDEVNGKFRDEDLEGTDSTLDAFRSAFEQTFKENSTNLKKPTDNCWHHFRKKSMNNLKLIGSSSDPNADKDQNKFDKNLNTFIEKFIFVTDLKIEDIESRTKHDLKKNSAVSPKLKLQSILKISAQMKARDIQDTYSGIDYQFKLLELFAHRSAESGIKFELSSELTNAGKFDDVVFKVSDKNGISKLIFGQAKYKKNPINLTFEMIMENKEFQVSKYFDSFVKILSQQTNKNIDGILIITNNKIDDSVKEPNGLIKMNSNDGKTSLYFIEDTHNRFLNYIFKDIFKGIGKSFKFANGNQYSKEKIENITNLKSNFLGKKFNDKNNFDENLKLFMEKLVFVTDLKVKDIECKVKNDLQKKLKLNDVTIQYEIIKRKIEDLIMKRGNSVQPITNVEYENIFEVFELFEYKIKVVEKTKSLFDRSLLEFVSTEQEIKDFLDLKVSQPKNILHIKTQPLEINLLSMQMYSILSSTAHKDTFIIMRSSFDEKDFERGIKVFEMDDLCEFLIIELDSDSRLFDYHKERIIKNSSKRMIVISDVKSRIKLSNCRNLTVPHIYPNVLKIKSQDQVLNQSVKFQNYETKWSDLVVNDKDFLLKNVLLSDLQKTKMIAKNVQVSKDYDKNLYIPRTFECKHFLKPEALKECENDEFVYNEQEFQSKSKSNPAKNIHWLKKSAEALKWIKSSKDISAIIKYIDDGKNDTMNEDLFAVYPSRVSILADVAGMGKSTVLNHLAQHMKRKNPNNWIIKIDLNDYTEELEEAKSKDLGTSELATEFLIEKILKLDSKIEKCLFKRSCEVTGNVILLFDGFDDVASYYKNQVSQFIDSLLKISVQKIFIATRLEWAEYLEEEFKQIKYYLKPFNKQNQENYLQNFMKKKIHNSDEKILRKIINGILGSMSKSVNDHDYKITGVPLIIKLVGEFFEQIVCEYFKKRLESIDEFTRKIEKNSFDLPKLYEYFFTQSVKIYFEQKLCWLLTNPVSKRKYKSDKKTILKNYKKLAIQQILKTNLQQYFPSAYTEEIDEDDLDDLVKVGLVNKDRKFVHQSYGEWCFSKYLDEHFDDEDCSKFIVEVVLVNESYKIIRTFINAWISEKNSEKSFEIYREKLLANLREETLFHVAGRERKENILRFLYSSLAKTERFESRKAEIEAYLNIMPKYENYKT